MKLITLTLHINSEECETIITSIDELKTVLMANYGGDIQGNHLANKVITDNRRKSLEGKMNNVI
jgi:hypothetical protein